MARLDAILGRKADAAPRMSGRKLNTTMSASGPTSSSETTSHDGIESAQNVPRRGSRRRPRVASPGGFEAIPAVISSRAGLAGCGQSL